MFRALRFGVGGLLTSTAGLAILGALQAPRTALPPGVRGKHVLVDGVPIRFLQAGAGPDVLLIHGSPGSLEDWDPIFETLPRRCRVTAFDRIGQGYSGGAKYPHTPAENARFAFGLIEALGLRDVMVVGHSYGGLTALHMALLDTRRLRALVIVGSRTYPPAPAGPLFRILALPWVGQGLAVLFSPFGAGQVAAGVREAFGPNADRIPAGFVETRGELWTRPTVAAALAEERVTAHAALREASPRWSTIRLPTVVVCGTADRNFADAARLAMEIPGARFVALDGVGHYVQFARPAELIEAIEGLLE